MIFCGVCDHPLQDLDSTCPFCTVAGSDTDIGLTGEFDMAVCRRCGCNDINPCPGGCVWAMEDLCSRCA